MPKTLVSRDVIIDAVRRACRAPSFHNSQPWRWIAEGTGQLELHLDRDRLVDTDSSGRQALISCGAVLDHFSVAMSAQNFAVNVDYFPNPDDHTHVASIDFTPMGYATSAHRFRAEAMASRRTDRLPFAPPAEWADFAPLLRQYVDGVAHVDILDSAARPLVAEASQLTEALRLYDSAYHAELDWWTALFEVTDGIPHSSLVSAAESDRVDIGRSFPVTHRGDRRLQYGEDASTVLVISALDDTRRDILACGETLSAILLDATVAGMATCTLTHVTEVPAAREIVSALTGRALPQALIRVGSAPILDAPPPPTPRRPVTDVLVWKLPRS